MTTRFPLQTSTRVVVVVGEEVDHPAAPPIAARIGRVAAADVDVPGDGLVAVHGEEPDVAAAPAVPLPWAVPPFDGDLRRCVDGHRAVGGGELHVDPAAVGAVAVAAHHDRAAAGVDLAADVDAAAAWIRPAAAVEQPARAGRRQRVAAPQIELHLAGDVDVAGARRGRDGSARSPLRRRRRRRWPRPERRR